MGSISWAQSWAAGPPWAQLDCTAQAEHCFLGSQEMPVNPLLPRLELAELYLPAFLASYSTLLLHSELEETMLSPGSGNSNTWPSLLISLLHAGPGRAKQVIYLVTSRCWSLIGDDFTTKQLINK